MIDHQSWDQRYAAPEPNWTAEPNRFLVTEVNGLPPGRALDLACGQGHNAVWLAAQGWQVTGLDCSHTVEAIDTLVCAHRPGTAR